MVVVRMNLFANMKEFIIFVAFALAGFCADGANTNLKVKNVERVIDVTSQLVKVSNILTFENTASSPVSSFIYVLDSPKEKLAYFLAQSGDASKTPLKFTETVYQGQPAWSIELKEPLQQGKSIVVDVETLFTHFLVPHPAHITQKEKQLVLYNGNHYFYSPYQVVRQTTAVNLASKNIESYSKLKPVSVNEATISYGPFENIPPLSVDPMAVHYENNSPFLTVTNLERVIEVSHWGNIAVEETVDLRHTGAILKGPFSRYDYQRESHSGMASIKSFKTILPAAATDAYYRDEIGNISTSHMKILSDSVELDLRPRFPLFGGWKTHYVIGYNVPSYEYLYNSGDDYLLKMRFLDHIFDDMIVDEITTKIILPEGASNIKLIPPYTVTRLPDSVHTTYLDTKGRTVLVLKKKNLVENHIQDFKLLYKFPRFLMLQEPLLIVVAFYLLFLCVIIYVRLDFSITKDEVGETRMRVAGYCDKLLNHHDKRAMYYRAYDELLTKLKLEKNVSQFQAAVKVKNQEYRAETSHINEYLTKLKKESPDAAEKVQELQRLDKQLKDFYTQHQNLCVDKLGPGKTVPKQYVEYEHQLNKKKEEVAEKINSIVKSLH